VMAGNLMVSRAAASSLVCFNCDLGTIWFASNQDPLRVSMPAMP
jgi:hypothetical protein